MIGLTNGIAYINKLFTVGTAQSTLSIANSCIGDCVVNTDTNVTMTRTFNLTSWLLMWAHLLTNKVLL